MDASCEKFVKDLISCHCLLEVFAKDIGEDWHPNFPPVTILFAALGRGLGEIISTSSEAQLQKVSSCIEAGFVSGTPELRDAIGAGLLEALSKYLNKADGSGEKFFSMLGPKSAQHVNAWTGCD